MALTTSKLQSIAPNLSEPKLSTFCTGLNMAMSSYDIITPEDQAMFIAQVMHESAECRYSRELASGQAYEGRKDLGNTSPGDGVRYKGRGLIQITGKANYQELSKVFDVDFIKIPSLLERPDYACLSAAWFWSSRKLSDIVKTEGNTLDTFKKVTKKINGGYNGLEDRLKYWERSKNVLLQKNNDAGVTPIQGNLA